MNADAPDLNHPASSSSAPQKMSVSDIFRDELGKARLMPSWLSTQLFSTQESLVMDALPSSDPTAELAKHQSADDDGSSDSSDDGLGNTPEFLSGRYVPSPSIARFNAFLPRASAVSAANGTADDSDDDDDDAISKTVAEGDVSPHAEIAVDWGSTPHSGTAPPPLAPPLPAASEFAPAEDVNPAAPDALSKSVVAIMDVQSRYLKALRLVERAYINVIRASHVLHRKPRLMNETEMTAAFVNWRDLVTIATELKRGLRQGRQSAGENEIAALTAMLNTIAAHIASYGRIYLIFVSEFTYSTKSLQQIRRRREAFNELVELNEACDKRELGTLMSAPLHYMAELRDAIRRLNRSLVPDASTSLQRSGLDVLCARTYTAVARLDDEITREKALSEARSRVGQVQEFLFDGKVNLIQPGRYCVRYGVLLKLTNSNKKDGKLLTFFLFNDLFLGADGKAGQMRVKYVLDLADLKATQTGPTTFHIESSVKSLLLAASSEQTATAWIHDINEQVHGLGDRAPRPDPLAVDALIRDDAKRLDATVAFSVRESHDLLTAKKEMTLVSMATTMPEPSSTTTASPMNAHENLNSLNDDVDGTATATESMTLVSSPAPAPAFKIHLTAAGEESGLGIGMQGYLKMRGTTFSSLSTMFFVVNGSKQELNGWKLKADALKSAPKKTIPLKESVTFASELPEGAGLELFPADNRRAYILIAPDATIRDAWCLELSKYRPPDRICEAFFEKRGGSDGQKPWRTRYFVMCRSRRSILYFNKRQDSAGPDWQLNANGSIDINDCHVERMECGEAMQVLDRRHVLELAPKSTQRHFYLSSKDEAVLVQWIDEIRRLSNTTDESATMTP